MISRGSWFCSHNPALLHNYRLFFKCFVFSSFFLSSSFIYYSASSSFSSSSRASSSEKWQSYKTLNQPALYRGFFAVDGSGKDTYVDMEVTVTCFFSLYIKFSSHFTSYFTSYFSFYFYFYILLSLLLLSYLFFTVIIHQLFFIKKDILISRSLSIIAPFSPGLLEVTKSSSQALSTRQGWIKGVVFINGFNLGRYWNVGPQRTLYLPAPLLRSGRNEVITECGANLTLLLTRLLCG